MPLVRLFLYFVVKSTQFGTSGEFCEGLEGAEGILLAVGYRYQWPLFLLGIAGVVT
jgi:hypothetical protein